MSGATNLMKKAAEALFPEDAGEQAAFLASLLRPEPRGSAILWTVPRRAGEIEAEPRGSLPPWLPEAVELARPGVKAGLSPAYAAGEVYPLDFASVATGSAMLAAAPSLPPQPRVLDLCAAPGGKSILASVLLRPALLLANEVEPRRLGPLRHNLARCRVARAFTQRLDPAELAAAAPAAFDLCLVDAPCSGQSLLAKGIANPGCFHPSVVKGNARRQSRILAAAAETVGPGGFLLYTTCTFSRRENEGAVERLLAGRPDFAAVEVPHLAELRSPFAPFPSYRVYPHRGLGVGGFAALLRREGEAAGEREPLPPSLLGYPIEPA
jgi:16S rRNA C967 or C1407 C5-methylase (RsmB/RsmF family)